MGTLNRDIWFIGDTHFGHANILTFEATKPYRPFSTIEDHDEELIKRWNSVVKKQDIVWMLGDFALSKSGLKCGLRLNGVKKLVMGNHDIEFPTSHYLKIFHKIYGAVAWQGKILTHIPVHPNQFERFGEDALNVHGHLHTWPLHDKRYICVSAEQVSLTPIHFTELRELGKRQQEKLQLLKNNQPWENSLMTHEVTRPI